VAAEAEAYALAAVSQAPEPFRRMLSAVFGGRPGVMRSTDWAVTQNGTPNMSVNVAAGAGLVLGSESSTQGGYFCQSTSTTNLAITTANPTNPRRDLVVARIRDAQYATGPTSAFDLFVVTGTAAASPVDPTVPANCLVVARVAVAALASSIVNANITDLRATYTGQTAAAALGGVIPCTSTARPTVGLYEGLVAYETDTDRAIVYNGSAWVGVGAGAAPQPQFFADFISGGTAGAATAYGTHNSIGTAPYPLTMIVETWGDESMNSTGAAAFLSTTDEAGTNITQNANGITPNHLTMHCMVLNQWAPFYTLGKKDYTAGQTMGFRVRYHVSSNAVSISANSRVTFVPKPS
jgi:hypothetical protein